MATADASPDTPRDPQSNPLAGRTEADGPLFEYELRVLYPNEGGHVTESGQTTATSLVSRLRDEANQIERIAGLLSLSDSARRQGYGRAGLVKTIRGFIAEQVGFDGGEGMTDQAQELADRLLSGPLRGEASGTPAELLRETLAIRDMTQAELATRTGLSTKHINQIAQGKVAFGANTALLFERALGVPAEQWLRLECVRQLANLRATEAARIDREEA